MARALVADLSNRPITAVVHSDMRRTRPIAEAVAQATRCPLVADPRWRERDFAGWEGRTWNAIWRETGNEMDRMMTDPSGFRPGGGDTGADVAGRTIAAWHDLPWGGLMLVVAHGGSIAALRTWLAGDPLEQMVTNIPACGTVVDMPRG